MKGKPLLHVVCFELIGVLLGAFLANCIIAATETDKSVKETDLLIKMASINALSFKPAHALSSQQDKPVEQTHKNIQVLKGLPDSKLISVMNFMRTSLGVSCAYCHVNSGGNNWEFEKDDKPTKQTARRMIQMVYDINKGNRNLFAGNTVSCFTCHRGSLKPLSLPSLPLRVPEGGVGGTIPKAEETLPTVAQLIDKYVKAVGGADADTKVRSRVMKGSLITWNGTNIPLEARVQSPDKLIFILTSEQRASTQGLAGASGWIKTEKGTRAMNSAELARMKAAVAAFDVLKVKAPTVEMKVIGREVVNGHEAYVITRPLDQGRIQNLYFDTQSGLLLRELIVTETILFRIPEQTDFEEYKDVDGVKLPFLIRSSFIDPWVSSTRSFSTIKSAPVNSEEFSPPGGKK